MLNQQQINKLLAFFSRKIIAKYQPLVIGITGSVGKTSTRHAIAAILATKFQIREPEKNYNNEIGIPLTVIGAKGLDEETSFLSRKLGWIRIFLKGLVVWLLPQNYPKVLVLEYGIDHTGDMDNLIAIVKPNLTVITTIGISHRANFNTPEEIAVEKGKLARCLKAGETFIYNIDDVHVAEQANRTSANTLSFGESETAQIKLVKTEEQLGLTPSTKLNIITPSRELTATIPVLGTAHVKAVLAGVAVAESLELETDLIKKGLANYRAMPGRLNVILGIKRTVLIDDTYNAAPVSTTEALKLLSRFPNPVKVAVLGDMLELGDLSESAHMEIGKLAASCGLSELVVVGELAKKIGEGAKSAGMSADSIISFPNSNEAKDYVLENLEAESVVLVKGSQGARMEKITKELLAEPTAATQLLVRQYGKWLSDIK